MNFALLQPGDLNAFGVTSFQTLPLECSVWAQTNAALNASVELLSVTQSLKPGAGSITVTKRAGAESPRLYSLCLSATPLGKGANQITTLSILQYEKNQLIAVSQILLRDAVIQDIQFQKTPDGQCTETLQLGFSQILWSHQMQSLPPPRGESSHAGWNFTTNAPITNIAS